MPNGTVADYLYNANPRPSLKERLKWALQAAEAVAYVHTKCVLHCNIGVGNLLLDKNLNIKLCDFQGKLLHPDGTIRLDGESAEDTKSSMPRSDPNDANQKTDIFALGSAIYFIIEGHPPFPELDSRKDTLEIVSRFKSYQFPALDEELGGVVVEKCWAGKYESADEVLRELKDMNMA
jgi:serine/threonine protein kinase